MLIDHLSIGYWYIEVLRSLEDQFHILEPHGHWEARIAVVPLPDHAAVALVDRALEERGFDQHAQELRPLRPEVFHQGCRLAHGLDGRGDEEVVAQFDGSGDLHPLPQVTQMHTEH